ncbi:MAG: hypothetical protein LIO56_02790, partial [Lachnospiraceae bacterium]|nr:hypothetical protein [Lachnospiraceae bacterium]
DADTHTVVWNIEAEAYEEGSVQLTVKVNESAAGSVVDNTASVQIGNSDSVDTNTVEIPVKSENEGKSNPTKPNTVNPDNSNPNTTGGTKTGDVDMTYFWILLMVAAAAVVVAGVTRRTKSRINK